MIFVSQRHNIAVVIQKRKQKELYMVEYTRVTCIATSNKLSKYA